MTPSVTKAVIPAAGLGTRFLPATKAQPKEMLPVVDKPAIQYVLQEKGKHADFDQVVDIAELADIHYVRQGEPLGLGHAVSVARKHVGDDPFAVMLGDDIMDRRSQVLEGMISTYDQYGRSVIALKEFPLDEISSYGC